MNKRGYSALAFAVLAAVMFLFYFGSADGPYNSTNTEINNCGAIEENGTYTLTANIGSGGDCLVIAANNVRIIGNGKTINGGVNANNDSVDGDNNGGNAYTNLTIENVTISEGISLIGANANNNGGNGGLVNLTYVAVLGSVVSQGGVGDLDDDASGNGGSGGNIALINSSSASVSSLGGVTGGVMGGAIGGSTGIIVLDGSTTGNINSIAARGDGQRGGNAGKIVIINSTALNVNGFGGGSAGVAGNGSNIEIYDSYVKNVSTTGGSDEPGNLGDPGDAGYIILIRSVASNLNLSGGYNPTPTGFAGSTGNLTIINSTANAIVLSGGIGDPGGSSGNITITNSTTGSINSSGGYAAGAYYAGSTGQIIVSLSRIGSITSLGGGSDISVRVGSTGQIIISLSSAGEIFSSASGDSRGAGGSSGNITVYGSTTGSINSIASACDSPTPAGSASGGDSGNITIINSTTGLINSRGGDSVNSCSRPGFSADIFILNSTTGLINSTAGTAMMQDIAGGRSGKIVIINSNVSSISSKAGTGYPGGSSGSIVINDSVVYSSINGTGANSNQGFDGNGGNGATIILTNVSFSTFNVSGGIGDPGGVNGYFGNVTRYWWVGASAIRANGLVLSGVNITIYNKSVNVFNSQLTDSNGNISFVALKQYYYNGTNYYYFSNYTINATISERTNATESINLTTNKNIVFNLVDVLAPSVSLTSPVSGTSYNGEPVDVQFIWDASDSGVGIANCTIWLKGNPYYNTSAITATSNNRTLSLGPASYVANVSCIDYDGNVGNSSVISFTISAPTQASTSSGGGAISYSSSLSQDSSLTKSLAYGDQIRFSYSGSGGSESHTLTLDSTNGDSATFTIRSDPITLTMKVNETRKIDLNKDGIYDVLVVLNKIIRGRVDVTIKKINEAIEGKESVPVEVNNQGIQNVTISKENKNGIDVNKILESVLVVFVIALLIIAVVLARNLKFKKRAGAIRIKSYKGR